LASQIPLAEEQREDELCAHVLLRLPRVPGLRHLLSPAIREAARAITTTRA
jgi:hypothetical protein